MHSIIKSLWNIIDRGMKGLNLGLSMGLPKLEKIMDGVQRQTYSIICGGTGSGKTTLALYSYVYKPLTEHLGDMKYRIVYYSLEMTAEILIAKLLSLHIYETYGIELTYKQIISKQDTLSEDMKELLDSCIPWLEQILQQLTIIDKATSADALYASLHEYAERNGTFEETDERMVYTSNVQDELVQVIVDHLGLLKRVKNRNKKEEMDLGSNYLMTFRNMCGYSPLVLLQLNRSASSMDRRGAEMQEIELGDIKDSGGPSEDAEVILAIFHPWREKMSRSRGYNIKILQDKYRAIQVLKNRLGEADKSVSVNFFGSIGYWKEFDLKGEEMNQLDQVGWNRYLYLIAKTKEEIVTEQEAVPQKITFRF